MPQITVNLGSSRPGGIDISLAGLVNQTFQDFEVVFVDGRYHSRHAQVLDAVKRSGLKQPFYHVPNHRYRADPMGSSSAGFNTGFALCDSKRVVMLLDYAFTPPGWLEAHATTPDDRPIMNGPVQTRKLVGYVTKDGEPALVFDNRQNIDGLPFEVALANIVGARERFDEISVFEEPFTASRLEEFPFVCDDPRPGIRDGGPLEWPYFYTRNESFPVEAVLKVNGMDENCDRACLQGDLHLGLRMGRVLGTKSIWPDVRAEICVLSPHPILPKPVCVMTTNKLLPPPFERYWPIHHPFALGYGRAIENDKTVTWAPNPFKMEELREELWIWREMSQEREAIIPKNVVADEDYYDGLFGPP